MVKVFLLDKTDEASEHFEFKNFSNFNEATDFINVLLPKISINLCDLDIVLSFCEEG